MQRVLVSALLLVLPPFRLCQLLPLLLFHHVEVGLVYQVFIRLEIVLLLWIVFPKSNSDGVSVLQEERLLAQVHVGCLGDHLALVLFALLFFDLQVGVQVFPFKLVGNELGKVDVLSIFQVVGLTSQHSELLDGRELLFRWQLESVLDLG